MAKSATNSAGKKLIHIDVSSDSVCPWCFVGKRNLDKAITSSKDQFDFQIKWHPFFLNHSAPKEGVNKRDFYREKFGSRSEQMVARMTNVFRGLDLEYNIDGLTGSTLDSHRLIYYAGQQGIDKQHSLVEELFLGYFTRAEYIGDRDFLVESARKVGIEGAAELLDDPNNCLTEVKEELDKYSSHISGVPYFVVYSSPVTLAAAIGTFFLELSAPKGVSKRDFYRQKFGSQYEQIIGVTTEIYMGLGLEDGLTSLEGLVNLTTELFEWLFDGYMIKGKYIGDWEFLKKCAEKVGLEGADEFLENPNSSLKDVLLQQKDMNARLVLGAHS